MGYVQVARMPVGKHFLQIILIKGFIKRSILLHENQAVPAVSDPGGCRIF